MASIPGTFHRKTKHKKPRHQLYIPGFNEANSCWLDGDWITVSAEEYEERHRAHHRMFKKATKKQGHHRGKGTPLNKRGEAQRMAWEHYAGSCSFYVRQGDSIHPCNLGMAGNKPKPDQVKWLRDNGYTIIRFNKNGHTGEVSDALEGLEFPDDLVDPSTEPVDPWATMIAENKQREADDDRVVLYCGMADDILTPLLLVPDARTIFAICKFDSAFCTGRTWKEQQEDILTMLVLGHNGRSQHFKVYESDGRPATRLPHGDAAEIFEPDGRDAFPWVVQFTYAGVRRELTYFYGTDYYGLQAWDDRIKGVTDLMSIGASFDLEESALKAKLLPGVLAPPPTPIRYYTCDYSRNHRGELFPTMLYDATPTSRVSETVGMVEGPHPEWHTKARDNERAFVLAWGPQ